MGRILAKMILFGLNDTDDNIGKEGDINNGVHGYLQGLAQLV